MQVNESGVNLVKNFGGLRTTAYFCPAGIPTIGYGHTRSVSRQDVGKRSITSADADRLLMEDLERCGKEVDHLVNVGLTDNQFSALASFVFNVGVGNFSTSTLLKRLNEGGEIAAAAEFDRWVYATVGGVKTKLAGLVKRRVAEKALFLEDIPHGEMAQAISHETA